MCTNSSPEQCRVMLWGSVRLRGILEDRRRDDSEPNERMRAVPLADQHSEIDMKTTSNIEMLKLRQVKQNPFPARYLLQRDDVPKISGAYGAQRCRSSLLDITTAQASHLHHASGAQGKKPTRRPRLQRKADWDVVIGDLLKSDSNRSEERRRQRTKVPSRPVLQSVLAGTTGTGITVLSTNLPQVRPLHTSSIAGVMSNLLFDCEVLLMMSQNFELFRNGSVRNANCRSHSPVTGDIPAVEDFHETPTHLHKIFLQVPIMPRTSLYRSDVNKVSAELLSESWIDEKSTLEESSPIQRVLRRKVCDYADLTERFLGSYRNSNMSIVSRTLHELPASSIIGNTGAKITCSYFWGKTPCLSTELSHDPEETYFCRDADKIRTTISQPIVAAGQISRKLHSESNVSTISTCRERDQSCLIPGSDSLSSFTRDFSVHELGFWCSGSREIFRKSRHSLARILKSSRSLSTSTINLDIPKDVQVRPDYYSGNLGVEALFGIFKVIIAKRYPGKKWKKFSTAIESQLSADQSAEDKEAVDTICAEINSYDPPKRRRSVFWKQIILSRYGSNVTHREHSAVSLDNQCSEVQDRSASDVGVFEDLYFSDDEFKNTNSELHKLASLQVHKDISNEDDTVAGSPATENDTVFASSVDNARRIEGNVRNRGALNHRKSPPPYFQIPDEMVCAGWCLKIAEYCLTCVRKGVLFLPPPLSALPLTAVILNSYLAETTSDHRAVVICNHENDMISDVAEYFDFFYRRDVSIETFSLKDAPETKKRVLATTARVLILDSFDFPVVQNISWLLVLGRGGVAFSSQGTKGVDISVSAPPCAKDWSFVPSILIVPDHPRCSVFEYGLAVNVLAESLGITDVVFIPEKDDINHAVLLSRPDYLFLVPPHEVVEFLRRLDEHAGTALEAYRDIAKQRHEVPCASSQSSALRDIDEFLILQYLKESSPNERCFANIELLHCLCQARRYALYDGYGTAIAYLKHALSTVSSQIAAELRSVLFEEELPSQPMVLPSQNDHPMIAAVTRALNDMEKHMQDQAPLLQSVRRKARFRPLILTCSLETYRGILSGLPNSKDLFEAQPGDIAVCELQRLCYHKARNGKSTHRNIAELGYLPCLSHIIYVVHADSRKLSLSLPANILQYVHAGSAHLLTICVDESREMEHAWEGNQDCYRMLSKKVESSKGMQQQSSCINYIVPFPFPTFEPLLRAMHRPAVRLWYFGRNILKGALIEQNICARVVHAPANNQVLQISMQEVMEMSVDTIRDKFRSHLQVIRSGVKTEGLISVCVPALERCSRATTKVVVALAGDEELIQHLKVEMLLSV